MVVPRVLAMMMRERGTVDAWVLSAVDDTGTRLAVGLSMEAAILCPSWPRRQVLPGERAVRREFTAMGRNHALARWQAKQQYRGSSRPVVGAGGGWRPAVAAAAAADPLPGRALGTGGGGGGVRRGAAARHRSVATARRWHGR